VQKEEFQSRIGKFIANYQLKKRKSLPVDRRVRDIREGTMAGGLVKAWTSGRTTVNEEKGEGDPVQGIFRYGLGDRRIAAVVPPWFGKT